MCSKKLIFILFGFCFTSVIAQNTDYFNRNSHALTLRSSLWYYSSGSMDNKYLYENETKVEEHSERSVQFDFDLSYSKSFSDMLSAFFRLGYTFKTTKTKQFRSAFDGNGFYESATERQFKSIFTSIGISHHLVNNDKTRATVSFELPISFHAPGEVTITQKVYNTNRELQAVSLEPHMHISQVTLGLEASVSLYYFVTPCFGIGGEVNCRIGYTHGSGTRVFIPELYDSDGNLVEEYFFTLNERYRSLLLSQSIRLGVQYRW